jgi:hypothetical protein
VVANTLVAEGDNLVYASGSVEVTRPDMVARSDSAFMDGQREFARLMRTPSVESRKGRKFTLTGGTIDLYSRSKSLERVLATPSGHVVSEDLELLADSVDLRVRENQLQQMMAWGRKSRARAISPDRQVIADSIDAQLPNQRLREVRASGTAYANSIPDCRIRQHSRVGHDEQAAAEEARCDWKCKLLLPAGAEWRDQGRAEPQLCSRTSDHSFFRRPRRLTGGCGG